MKGAGAAVRGPLGAAVKVVLSGVVGVTLVESFRSGRLRRSAREGAVRATALGLRAQRRAEVRAEDVRLGWGDIVAEARERVGEDAPPPSATGGHDHDHAH